MEDRLIDMRRALLSAANADGGWGYYPGKASRLEPTCWALLALLPSDSDFKRPPLRASRFPATLPA